jgi:hypothetical protein
MFEETEVTAVEAPVAVAVPESTIIFPFPARVTLGDETFTVARFKAGKMLLVLETVTELLDNPELQGLLMGGNMDSGEIMKRLASELPTLIRTATPVIGRAVALTITPDADIARALDNGEDVRADMTRKGRVIVFSSEVDELIEALAVGIQCMGLDALRQSLPNLGKALGLGR